MDPTKLYPVGTTLQQSCVIVGYAIIDNQLFYVVRHEYAMFTSITCTACTNSFLVMSSSISEWLQE
jgi:hypothetical protein